VAQKQTRRWLTISVLGLSSLVFIGMSIIPLVGGIMEQRSAPPVSSTATPAANAETSPEAAQKDEASYELVLKRNPDDKTALGGLVEARLKLIQLGVRQPKDVIEPLTKLAKLNPDQLLFTTMLAQAQAQSGDLTSATQTYQSVLAKEPTNTEAVQGYIFLLLKQQQTAAALDTLDKAIATAKQKNQQQPGSADTLALELLSADVYLAQQKPAEAIALYDRLRKEAPNDFRPAVAKGIVMRNQGKNAEALALFQTASSLAPAQIKDKIQPLIASVQTPSAATSPTPPTSTSPLP
jgi:tetratricopeptide (TPR) repeat protein